MTKIVIFIFAFVVGVVLCSPTPGEKSLGNSKYCEDWNTKFEKDKEVVSVPGQCLKVVCVNPEINEMLFTICPQVDVPPDCHASKVNPSKPYPDCCSHAVCKKTAEKP